MKRSIFIFCTAVALFSLTAFAYTNWNHTVKGQDRNLNRKSNFYGNDLENPSKKQNDLDLYYNIGNRWSTMTKEDLSKVKSLNDIISDREDGKTRDSFKNVTVSVLHNDKDVRDIKTSEMGQSEIFSAAQIKLIRSMDYSTNLRITALSRLKDAHTGTFEDDSLVQYMTIIPEKEAEFEGGFNPLIDYLKESIKGKAAIIEKDQVQPGKVFFTVTNNGTIHNIKLVETSGYPSVDKELVKIISNMPEKWNPATNSKGEKVDQEFVFYFGIMGC